MMTKTLLNVITVILFCVSLAMAMAPERDIAEWVIRQGGRVILEGDRHPIADVVQLPAGELRITGIDLTGTLIDPKDLEKLSGLAHLKELYLPGPIWNPG